MTGFEATAHDTSGLTGGRTDARQVNETWAMDFVHDQLATGGKIRTLTVIDTYSRFSPAVDARFSYRGEDVVQTLERVCKIVGYPKAIRVDQGAEFISRDLDLWTYQRGIILDFSRPNRADPGEFSTRWLSFWEHFKPRTESPYKRGQTGEQVTRCEGS